MSTFPHLSMDASNELDAILDSLNLTGQYQPSALPDITDSSLNDQILGDIVFSDEDIRLTSTFSQNDDISNALVDPMINSFNAFHPVTNDVPESPSDDDLLKLLSLPIEGLHKQSSIEDSMERIALNQSSSEVLSSVSSVPMGSSPVERKEIDNYILANQFIKTQTRIYKHASKSRKISRYESASSSVGPIDVLSSYGGCQPCTTTETQDDLLYDLQNLQFDSMELKKIQFKCQPRARFRPRTQAESKNVSHYIRCELNDIFEYPTVYIPSSWSRQSMKNILEVTLVQKDGQPHLYVIDNKTSSPSYDENALIFKQNESNSLYFCVTKEDFDNGYKCLMVEFIKRKQDDIITKDIIRSQQLDQSMLRVTRIYQTEPGVFQRDESSTEYSNLMVEDYGNVAVEHMGPRYGPIGGNEGVYALLKGRLFKDDIAIFVSEPSGHWRQQIPFTKNQNTVYFTMPAYPYSGLDEALVDIIMYHKGEELHRSPYLYQGTLDQALSRLGLHDSATTASRSSTPDIFSLLSATGALPVRASPKKSSTAKSTKRLTRK